jgi:hypothetical protein
LSSGVFFTPENVGDMKAFVYRISTSIEYRAGQGKNAPIKRLTARTAHELWMATEGGNFGRFQWDAKTLQFLFNRRPVAPEVPKAAANMVAREARFRMQDEAIKLQQLARGEIPRANGVTGPLNAKDLRSFRSKLMAATRASIGANAALGRGGWEQMTGSAWDAAHGRLKPHLETVDRIISRIDSGGYGPNINDGLLNHIGNLANAGRSVYENTRLDNATDELGHDEFKRLLGNADNCTSMRGFTGCIEAAAMDWVSRDEFIEFGGCTCHDGCNCVGISRRAGQDERLGLK